MDAVSPRSRRLPVIVAVAFATLVLLLSITWHWALTTPESRNTGRVLSEWIEAMEGGTALQTSFSIGSVSGFPKELTGQAAEISLQSPDRLRISTRIDGSDVEMGRLGDEVWVHLPEKEFALVADNETPRFTADPSSVLPVALPDLHIPVVGCCHFLLPALIEVSEEKGKEGESEISITPSKLARKWLDAPPIVVVAKVAAGDLQQLLISENEDKSIEIVIEKWEAIDHAPSADYWKMKQDVAAGAERVALSHLKRFAEVAARQLGSETPTLPPATGKRELVATSGEGRFERQDGVRILHLKGSPEEMGSQQGELLMEEVRAVTDRILYGVGVGTSFGKGKWFFGVIEDAQARVEPFTSETHLREMDALADASGLHRQEARLSNFFPELFHCSGFALHGAATEGGTLYHGRILDYMRGVGLEDNAVVTVYQPDDANAWVNLTYAGFIGSVTAMNEKHVAIGEMGGRGEGKWDGKPMAQLVRDVMEQCDTIEEAVELMRKTPRTCEYYYVISDGKTGRAVGIEATPDIFNTIWEGDKHPKLPHPMADTVLMSAGDRYEELVRRVKENYGKFDADSARELMTRPVCMKSNIQSVLFAPESLDFWIANADEDNVASHTRFTKFNLKELLSEPLP